MNRHSIFFKLNVLFVIAIVATVIAAFSMGMHIVKKERNELFFKSRLILKEMHMSGAIPYGLLKEFQFELVGDEQKRTILQYARSQKNIEPFVPRHIQKRRKIVDYKGERYLHLKARDTDLLLRDEQRFAGKFVTPLLVLFGILTLLVVMYVLLRKSLTPLKKLQRDIMLYGEGKLKAYEYFDQKDEVSLASDAFYRSVEKLETLRSSRDLFIRNLFHELNTPVTKGKLLAEIVEDEQTKEMLDSIFSRLSTLLKELAQMEKLTSESYTIHKTALRVRELIDEAGDLLYLNEEIQSNVTDELIDADFSLMSIVFKNLIDNGLKYGKNLKIKVDKEAIAFISEGEPLPEKLAYYTEPFSKGREIVTQEGFGLGLYIVDQIVKKHGMALLYEHKLGQNIFIIRL